DAITSINPLPERTTGHQYTQHFLTTGRDGNYAVHQISKSPRSNDGEILIEVSTKHRSSPTFGPNIEGAAFDHETGDLILWGFRSRHFVVWNAPKDIETMTIDCGGAHRNWHYTPRNDGSDGGTFVWTKTVLQSGGHGREIKAVGLSPMMQMVNGSRGQYIATGAEDTAIRIWSYNHLHGLRTGFRCLATLRKHITGIQALRWSKDGKYLFSAAGREELFAWRVQPLPILGIGILCESVCPPVTEDGDLRIMDFVLEKVVTDDSAEAQTIGRYYICVVYSDSSLRLYRYNSSCNPNPFQLLQSGTYNSINTLTQISFLHSEPYPFLCTASSDGYLAFWPLPQTSSAQIPPTLKVTDTQRRDLSPISKASLLKYVDRIRIHQNFIKTMCIIPLSVANSFLLITGGDDGGLGITLLRIRPNTKVQQDIFPHCEKRLLIPKAHAASVNSVVHFSTKSGSHGKEDLETHIVESVGGDQKVKSWEIIVLDSGRDIEVRKRGQSWTSVADPAGMENVEGGKLVIVGIGMEI
ncbi:MAG: hypothetical protein Q9183_006476, partial [Haloplaca sp. 2 TL-2023]